MVNDDKKLIENVPSRYAPIGSFFNFFLKLLIASLIVFVIFLITRENETLVQKEVSSVDVSQSTELIDKKIAEVFTAIPSDCKDQDALAWNDTLKKWGCYSLKSVETPIVNINNQIPIANILQTGLLANNDWATFASKEQALTFQDGLDRTGSIVKNALWPVDLPASGEVLSYNGIGTEWIPTSGTGTVINIDSGNGLSGGPISTTGTLSIDSPTCIGSDKLTWNGTSFVCSVDIDTDTNSGGTVTSITSGNGLGGGPITGSGTLSINSPICTGSDKLVWNGTAFVCSVDIDTNSGGTLTNIATGIGLAGGPITSTGTISIDAPTCVGGEYLSWDGSVFSCITDQIGTGTVTSVGSGNGLSGGTITASGTLSINSPTCSGTDKLSWNGTAFVCSADIDTDTNSGGTVTSITSGNGLSGGPITGSGTLSINSPTCIASERLTWNGTAFVCTSVTTAINSLVGGVTIEGTVNQVNVVTGVSTITLSTPQDIALGSIPTFAGEILSPGAISGSPVAGQISIDSGDSNNLKWWNGTSWVTALGSGTAFVKDGNSFGSSAILGTNDTQNLIFETDGAERMRITSNGLTYFGFNPFTTADVSFYNRSTQFYEPDSGALGKVVEILSLDTTTGTSDALYIDTRSQNGLVINATNSPNTTTHDLLINAEDGRIPLRINDQALDTTPFIVDPDGNVGIGTASVAGGIKLQVEGTARVTAFQLGTSATAGDILTTDSSGVGTWQAPAVKTIYNGTTAQNDTIMWNGTATTTGGVATFQLTNDGTGSGTALFTTIYSIQATASANVSSAITVPLASVKNITGDNKTLTVNVVDGVTAVLAGATLEFSGNGTLVYVTVIGK